MTARAGRSAPGAPSGTTSGAPPGKVRAPRPAPGLLARPRCVAELDEAVDRHRLVLVCAPAGYGKTTLLSQWAPAVAAPLVWASLDPLDDDPGRLAGVLADAVAQAAADATASPSTPGRLGAPGTVGARVDALVADLDRLDARAGTGAGAPAPVVVLDDVHLVSLRTARQVLTPLLRYASARLVLACRFDAGVPVNRLRISGQLGEVRSRSLAFTEQEVAELVGGHGRHPDRARDVWEVTRGWPVAVQLALAAGVLDDDGGPLRGVGARDVPLTSYLLAEVLGSLPRALADFVLRASVAGTIDPDLADAVVPGGAALLDECVARGLFLTPVGGDEDGRVAYRWHALVAAHARAVLARRDPAAARAAHRVVAEHRASTDPAAAIGHALEAQAPGTAASILGERWPDLVVRGEVGLIERLRSALPDPHAHAPDVLLALSAARAFDPGGAVGAGTAPAVVGDLVRTFLAPGRPPLGEAVRRGRALLARDDLDGATRALGLYLLGRAEQQRLGAAADPHAAALLDEAARLAAQRGWGALALGCRAESALARAQLGDLADGRTRALEVLRTAAAHGWSGSGVVATAHLTCGLVAYWRDDLDHAREQLAAAVEAAGRSRREVAAHAAGIGALVAVAQGDAAGLAAARAVLDAPWTDAGEPEHLPGFRDLVTAVHLAASGQGRAALARVDRRAAAFGDPLSLAWLADVLRRTGDRAGAWRAVHAGRPAAPGPPTPARVALAAAAALLHEQDGATDAAHRALEDALDLAAPQGVVRPLRDRAADLHPLLSAHLEWGSAHEELVARLLVAEQAAPAARTSAWDLTARERDVLACLRSSLTAEEIAASLYLSVNTVKTHMRAIYRKLGADGRRAAVRVAVQRGML
ncbi:LuxR C-terminal-related transcriptional regulator [Cellulomonas sp. NPDC058312]|uniref:LuxR C-terminal-related transcriptional regulator n=1 Tax=Cellulomonas sp. NPDC058312 TaxID=3346441 RepID=UPI0036DFB478